MSLTRLPDHRLELGLNLEIIIAQTDLLVRKGHAATLLSRCHNFPRVPFLATRRPVLQLRLHRQNGRRHALLTVARAAAAV